MLLEAIEVERTFPASGREPVRAVSGVTLAIARGSLTAIAGRNGSGKTTLLSLLGAQDRATGGQVLFDGQDLSRYSDAQLARTRRRMGFVFQDFGLLHGISAIDNVTYPLVPRGIPQQQRVATAERLLEQMEVAYCRDKRPTQMSGGECQRVAVARALAGEPEVLLADEPTSNLDDEAAVGFISLLQQVHEAGTTVVVATHDSRMLDLADTVFRMDRGRLVDAS